MFICMEIPRSAAAMLAVIFNSANNLVFLCMERHNLIVPILQLSHARKKGQPCCELSPCFVTFSWNNSFLLWKSNHLTIFTSSVAEIFWFIYCCLVFSYEESLWKAGFLPFSRAQFREHQRHFALVFGRMQQSNYPSSDMQLFKKVINEIFMENKSWNKFWLS